MYMARHCALKLILTEWSSGIDPRRFWVDFARELSAAKVQAPIQSFLHEYVESSYKERVILGPQERAMFRTVNSTYSNH